MRHTSSFLFPVSVYVLLCRDAPLFIGANISSYCTTYKKLNYLKIYLTSSFTASNLLIWFIQKAYMATFIVSQDQSQNEWSSHFIHDSVHLFLRINTSRGTIFSQSLISTLWLSSRWYSHLSWRSCLNDYTTSSRLLDYNRAYLLSGASSVLLSARTDYDVALNIDHDRKYWSQCNVRILQGEHPYCPTLAKGSKWQKWNFI